MKYLIFYDKGSEHVRATSLRIAWGILRDKHGNQLPDFDDLLISCMSTGTDEAIYYLKKREPKDRQWTVNSYNHTFSIWAPTANKAVEVLEMTMPPFVTNTVMQVKDNFIRLVRADRKLPEPSHMATYEAMLGLAAEMVLDHAIRVKREEDLQALIDEALTTGDKDKFIQYSTQLKSLNG